MKTLFLAILAVLGGYTAGMAQINPVDKKISDKMAKEGSGTVVLKMPQYVILEGDTLYVQTLRTFTVYSNMRTFKKAGDQKKYNRLVYNVRKVYPYAHRAGQMLREEEAKMTGLDKGDRRSHMKKVEKRLENEFGPELKSLNFTQGRILLKLIDRETGHTSYELVDDLRGTFRAWFYDGIAGLFGYDLKSEYDPHDHLEDRYIEEVVRMIEAGELSVVTIGERR